MQGCILVQDHHLALNILCLELHSTSCLMRWGWSRERWWITPNLHRKSLLIIWKQLGPQSTRTPLVTYYSNGLKSCILKAHVHSWGAFPVSKPQSHRKSVKLWVWSPLPSNTQILIFCIGLDIISTSQCKHCCLQLDVHNMEQDFMRNFVGSVKLPSQQHWRIKQLS